MSRRQETDIRGRMKMHGSRSGSCIKPLEFHTSFFRNHRKAVSASAQRERVDDSG